MTRAFLCALAALAAVSLTASAAVLSAPVPAISAPALPLRASVAPPAALAINFSSPLMLAPSIVPVTPLLVAPAPVPDIQAPETIAPARVAPSEPAREDAPEKSAVDAGARFDGTSAAPPAAPAPIGSPKANQPSAAPLGAGIRMAQSEHEEWLASVVGLLTGTRTGRRVLRDIDRLAARRGVPVLLDVKPIGNNGEFRYDSDLLIMDWGHLKRDPYQSAPILAHELQHVLQRAMDLPVDALELEIESYTVENRVWTELGAKPDAGSFARPARNRIMKDLPGFVKWLGGEYKNNIPLYGATIDAYVARLKKKLAAAKRSEAATRRKRAAVERVLESMRANGMSEEAIAAHRRDDLEPLDRGLRDGAVNRGWLERDILMLSQPEGRARFRAYARGVIRRARSLSRS